MKYIIDSEVQEEIDEIIPLIGTDKDSEIILCCPSYVKKPNSQVCTVHSYKYSKNRILNKIKQLLILFFLVVVNKPDVIFSGYPLLKHRLVNIFSFGRIRHFSYIRGLFADSNNYRGFSDYLYLKLKKHPSLIRVNNFQCDKIYTVSKLNVDFLFARGVHPGVIDLIPPPWLKKIKNKRHVERKCEIHHGSIYFVSQAFASHSSQDAAESQLQFAIKLRERLSVCGMDLIIRKHPRDNTDYTCLGFKTNSLSSYEFIERLNLNDVLISPFSTMAFEVAYCGIKTLFYSTVELDRIYSRVYEKLSLNPFYSANDIVNEIISSQKNPTDNVRFNNVFYDALEKV